MSQLKTYTGRGDTTHSFWMWGTIEVRKKPYTGRETLFVDGGNNWGGDTATLEEKASSFLAISTIHSLGRTVQTENQPELARFSTLLRIKKFFKLQTK